MPLKGKRKKRVKRTRAAACEGKTQYPSRAAAEKTRENYITKQGTDPNGVRAYRCQFCKHFHVGRIWRPDLRQVRNRARAWK
jgi:hypothetical protein